MGTHARPIARACREGRGLDHQLECPHRDIRAVTSTSEHSAAMGCPPVLNRDLRPWIRSTGGVAGRPRRAPPDTSRRAKSKGRDAARFSPPDAGILGGAGEPSPRHVSQRGNTRLRRYRAPKTVASPLTVTSGPGSPAEPAPGVVNCQGSTVAFGDQVHGLEDLSPDFDSPGSAPEHVEIRAEYLDRPAWGHDDV